MFRVSAGFTAAAAMLASGTFALAATNYSISVSAPGNVEKNHAFTIKASGFSKTKESYQLFLADEKCASTYMSEFKTATTGWKQGFPYFVTPSEGGFSTSLIFTAKGNFKQSIAAHGGKTTGTYHVCAYLFSTTGATLAHGSAAFKVTP